MRVKRGVTARAKHKKILKAAKGMQHNRTRSYRLAKQGVIRAFNMPTATAVIKSATYVDFGSPASTQLHAKTALPMASL